MLSQTLALQEGKEKLQGALLLTSLTEDDRRKQERLERAREREREADRIDGKERCRETGKRVS